MQERIKAGIDNYVAEGVPTGSFLRYVLENKLMEALGRADSDNQKDIFDICSYIYNDIRSSCHGSPKIVKKWIAHQGSKNVIA